MATTKMILAALLLLASAGAMAQSGNMLQDAKKQVNDAKKGKTPGWNLEVLPGPLVRGSRYEASARATYNTCMNEAAKKKDAAATQACKTTFDRAVEKQAWAIIVEPADGTAPTNCERGCVVTVKNGFGATLRASSPHAMGWTGACGEPGAGMQTGKFDWVCRLPAGGNRHAGMR